VSRRAWGDCMPPTLTSFAAPRGGVGPLGAARRGPA
jgi:hypothetical protein